MAEKIKINDSPFLCSIYDMHVNCQVLVFCCDSLTIQCKSVCKCVCVESEIVIVMEFTLHRSHLHAYKGHNSSSHHLYSHT